LAMEKLTPYVAEIEAKGWMPRDNQHENARQSG